MTELHEQIRTRVSEALISLQGARTEGDDHMVEVRIGELESLAHLAAEHGLHLPALEEYAATPDAPGRQLDRPGAPVTAQG